MPSVRIKPVSSYIGVVDDNDAVRHSIRILLESHGLNVAEFSSAGSLLRSPLRMKFTCLVIDQKMPDMTGLELTEQLRAEGVPTPVILMTAQPDAALVDRIQSANTLALLIKPIQQNELMAWIDYARDVARGRKPISKST